MTFDKRNTNTPTLLLLPTRAKRKRQLYRAFSFLFCMAFVVSCVTFPASSTSPNTEKEEVVYVTLTPDGSVSQIYVVNIFELTEDGQILDYGRYRDLRNLTTSDEIQFQDETVTIDTKAGRLYYEGTLEGGELPWIFSFTYFLDGVEYPADQLAGKSGLLEIHLESRLNPNANHAFFDKFALQVTLTLDADRCKNIQAESATIANSGGNKQITYTLLPGTEANLSLTADVQSFEMSAISIAGVPMDLDLSLDEVDFDEKFTPLTDGIQQLDDGAGELEDGSGALASGMQAFLSGVSDLKYGTAAMADYVPDLVNAGIQLKEGTTQLDNAVSALKDGTVEMVSGAESLSDGMEGLSSGILTFSDGVKDVDDGASQLAEGASEISDGIGALGDNASELTDGIGALEQGAEDLQSGLGTLKENLGDFSDGLQQSSEGLGDLNLGILLLENGVNEFEQGLSSLSEKNDSLIAISNQLYRQTLETANVSNPQFAALGVTASTTSAQLETLLNTRISDYVAEYAATLVTPELQASAYQTAVETRMASLDPTTEEYQYWQLTLLLAGEESYQSAIVGGASPTEAQIAAHQLYETTVASPPYNGDSTALEAAHAQLESLFAEEIASVQANAAQIVQDTVTEQAYAAVVTNGLYQSDPTCSTLIALNYYKGIVAYLNGVSQLSSNTPELSGGIYDLRSGALELQDGVQQLYEGSLSIEDGVGELKDGAGELKNGLSSLREGSEAFENGVLQLEDGSLELHSGMLELKNGTAQLLDGTLSLYDGALDLQDGTLLLRDGMVSLQDGVVELKNGSAQVAEGALALSDGLISFGNGVIELKDGTVSLYDGAITLYDGIVELHDGIITFKDGTFQLRDQTSHLGEKIKEGISDQIDEMLGRDIPISSFVSPKNTNVISVQFVMRTDDITIPMPQEEPEEEEPPLSLWQRVLALFGL